MFISNNFILQQWMLCSVVMGQYEIALPDDSMLMGSEPMSWMDARDYCWANDRELLSIHNDLDQNKARALCDLNMNLLYPPSWRFQMANDSTQFEGANTTTGCWIGLRRLVLGVIKPLNQYWNWDDGSIQTHSGLEYGFTNNGLETNTGTPPWGLSQPDNSYKYAPANTPSGSIMENCVQLAAWNSSVDAGLLWNDAWCTALNFPMCGEKRVCSAGEVCTIEYCYPRMRRMARRLTQEHILESGDYSNGWNFRLFQPGLCVLPNEASSCDLCPNAQCNFDCLRRAATKYHWKVDCTVECISTPSPTATITALPSASPSKSPLASTKAPTCPDQPCPACPTHEPCPQQSSSPSESPLASTKAPTCPDQPCQACPTHEPCPEQSSRVYQDSESWTDQITLQDDVTVSRSPQDIYKITCEKGI